MGGNSPGGSTRHRIEQRAPLHLRDGRAFMASRITGSSTNYSASSNQMAGAADFVHAAPGWYRCTCALRR